MIDVPDFRTNLRDYMIKLVDLYETLDHQRSQMTDQEFNSLYFRSTIAKANKSILVIKEWLNDETLVSTLEAIKWDPDDDDINGTYLTSVGNCGPAYVKLDIEGKYFTLTLPEVWLFKEDANVIDLKHLDAFVDSVRNLFNFI